MSFKFEFNGKKKWLLETALSVSTRVSAGCYGCTFLHCDLWGCSSGSGTSSSASASALQNFVGGISGSGRWRLASSSARICGRAVRDVGGRLAARPPHRQPINVPKRLEGCFCVARFTQGQSSMAFFRCIVYPVLVSPFWACLR